MQRRHPRRSPRPPTGPVPRTGWRSTVKVLTGADITISGPQYQSSFVCGATGARYATAPGDAHPGIHRVVGLRGVQPQRRRVGVDPGGGDHVQPEHRRHRQRRHLRDVPVLGAQRPRVVLPRRPDATGYAENFTSAIVTVPAGVQNGDLLILYSTGYVTGAAGHQPARLHHPAVRCRGAEPGHQYLCGHPDRRQSSPPSYTVTFGGRGLGGCGAVRAAVLHRDQRHREQRRSTTPPPGTRRPCRTRRCPSPLPMTRPSTATAASADLQTRLVPMTTASGTVEPRPGDRIPALGSGAGNRLGGEPGVPRRRRRPSARVHRPHRRRARHHPQHRPAAARAATPRPEPRSPPAPPMWHRKPPAVPPIVEIPASGTLLEDASAPAPVSTTSATSVTADPFTPPMGSLLVAQVATAGTDVRVQVIRRQRHARSGPNWPATRPAPPATPGCGPLSSSAADRRHLDLPQEVTACRF